MPTSWSNMTEKVSGVEVYGWEYGRNFPACSGRKRSTSPFYYKKWRLIIWLRLRCECCDWKEWMAFSLEWLWPKIIKVIAWNKNDSLSKCRISQRWAVRRSNEYCRCLERSHCWICLNSQYTLLFHEGSQVEEWRASNTSLIIKEHEDPFQYHMAAAFRSLSSEEDVTESLWHWLEAE